MGRQPNGRESIYPAPEGGWHTFVRAGKRRIHVRGRTASQVADKVAELKAKLDIGHVPQPGKVPTLGWWLEYYLATIAPRRIRASTLQGYESKFRHNIIPGLGHHKLSTPIAELAEHIEAWFARFERRVAPSNALQHWRILSRALDVAVKRGKLARNPMELLDPPSGQSDYDAKPLTAEEIRRILAEAEKRGALARWWVAMALTLRQGEALGLFWDHVDLDSSSPTLAVRWELIRLKWRHGCDESPCGKKRGADCPQRHGGGLVFEAPKSRRSRRVIPIPDVIVEVLRQHRKEQLKARMKAGSKWRRIIGPDGESGGLVFCGPTGEPTSPEADWEQWKQILVAADVRTVTRTVQRGRRAGQTYVTSLVRVHDARHTSGTVLRATGAERQELMEWMGHSQISVSARYTHPTEDLIQERARRLDEKWRDIAGLESDGAHRRRRRAQ